MVILLAEDNIADAHLTKDALAETGLHHEFHHVWDGEEAMRFLNKGPGYEDAMRPNIILLDLNMPKKHGFQVIIEIKGDQDLRRIPVIALSNSCSQNDVDDVYQFGGNAYLHKSNSLKIFFEKMKSMVDFWMETAQLPSVP